jgi:hypothetical protein
VGGASPKDRQSSKDKALSTTYSESLPRRRGAGSFEVLEILADLYGEKRDGETIQSPEYLAMTKGDAIDCYKRDAQPGSKAFH